MSAPLDILFAIKILIDIGFP